MWSESYVFSYMYLNVFSDKLAFKDKAAEWMARISSTIKKPEVYKPFAFLIVIFGLLELSGFAVLANYSIVLIKV